MTEIVGCICTYNSAETIEKTYNSIRLLVDRVVFIDGLMPEVWSKRNPGETLPGPPYNSQDRTLEICSKLGKCIVASQSPWKDETEARNKFWSEVGDGNWAFIIDSDEILSINDDNGIKGWRASILKEEAPAIQVTMKQTGSKITRPMVRLYKVQNGIHYYEGNHAHVTDQNNRDITSMAPWYAHMIILNTMTNWERI